MYINENKIKEWILLPEFADYKIFLEKILHFKPYVLSEKEERLLSLQMQSASTAETAFSVLTNVDMNKTFGSINMDNEEMPLTQSTWSVFMANQDRTVREKAYKQFYKKFEENQNVLAALYAGSVNQDVFYVQARGHESSLSHALYADKVPLAVYHNLIDCVHKNLKPLHDYYSLRKKVLGVDELRHYDVYVPLVKDVEEHTTYEEAVEICRNALAPLGKEYTDRLCDGLLNGWVDRYENVGKRSGAFSSGAFIGDPFILLNYQEDSIRDVFTMAHEGGHSMHSWYAVHNNPFLSYDYTIFEAEVASTFNEELVFQYLYKNAKTKEMKAYLLANHANDILATLYRQTMFAEFELKTHEFVEKGEDATIIKRLDFSKCRLSLAIPKEVNYPGVSWFNGKRIATSYPNILRQFLEKNNVQADIHVITGSVEIAPSINLADCIFDIVSSGSTLVTNNLKEVEVAMKSEALMIGNKNLSEQKQAILNELLFRFDSFKNAEGKKYIILNIPNDKIDQACALLPGMKSPTVTPLVQEGWSSLQSVIEEKTFWHIINQLKSIGAEGILVVPIEKMIL